MNPPTPRRHHYVPRLLLRQFAVERKPGKFQTTVFDKERERVFTTAIENVAVETDFYTAEIGGGRTFSMEAGLGFAEAMAANVLAELARGKKIGDFSDDEKTWLILFAALQSIRDKAFRSQFLQLSAHLRDHLIRVVGEENIPAEANELPDDDDLKMSFFSAVSESLEEFAQHLNDKIMVIYEAPDDYPFLLGDSPITMHNDREFGPYGNIGLAVPGIQIHLPISPKFTLAFLCRSHLAEMEEAIARAQDAIGKSAGIAILGTGEQAADVFRMRQEGIIALRKLEQHRDAFTSGESIKLEQTNVDHLNSLQVAHAERQIFSQSENFALVRRMISDNPAFKTGGKRVKIN